MEVKNLFVETIYLDEQTGKALSKAKRYEFAKAEWISPHREREGRRLGPMVLLDSQPNGKVAKLPVELLGERELHVEQGHGLAISYRDRWTVPSCTAYALVLPEGFVATHQELRRHLAYYGEPGLEVAVDDESRLFYHTVFGYEAEMQVFDLEMRIENDRRLYKNQLAGADIVRGTSAFTKLGQHVMSIALNPELLLALLKARFDQP